jgi:uncharacterized protein DUF1731
MPDRMFEVKYFELELLISQRVLMANAGRLTSRDDHDLAERHAFPAVIKALAYDGSSGTGQAAAAPPAFVRMGLGAVADILVRGKRVLPAKAAAAGYQFRFPALEPALRDILRGEPGE